jgi:hypothetical protein
MAEQDVRAAKRQEAALGRMEKKHAREVQVEVDKATVSLKGDVTKKERIARQTEAEIKTLQSQRRELMEQLERAIGDRNNDLKRIGRERRQWDVDTQALVEKCGGLSTMVKLRDKQDQSKKRQHKEAMAKANELCSRLKGKMKDILQQEGRNAYERKKFSRNIGLEKQAVTLAMSRVTCDQKKVDMMEYKITQRGDKLSRQALGIGLDRAKVQTAKKVYFYLSLTRFVFILPLCLL